MADPMIEVTTHSTLDDIDPTVWDHCACPEAAEGGRPIDPFTTYRFLHALERSGSVGDGTGWQPLYLLARDGAEVIGAAPLYVKYHSQGEYIFDFNWADAYERSGGEYYPKLQIAVPFTPATGRRFLVRPQRADVARQALMSAAIQLVQTNDLSSVHVTFCTDDEAEFGRSIGVMDRLSQQFHWENSGYSSFDDFLASLSSRKRKTIRKERAEANAFGGEIVVLSGDDVQPQHWDSFWQFYQDTGSRKWGTPYLTRAFFDLIHDTMRDDVVLVMARRDGRDIAGALNFVGRDTLFGRYWGAIEHHPFLHFECCYYRAIDYAIDHGLRVEAGAQGEHKLARGYLPTPTHSLHWIANPSFAKAIKNYLTEERRAIDHEIEVLTDYGPFRKVERDEQD